MVRHMFHAVQSYVRLCVDAWKLAPPGPALVERTAPPGSAEPVVSSLSLSLYRMGLIAQMPELPRDAGNAATGRLETPIARRSHER